MDGHEQQDEGVHDVHSLAGDVVLYALIAENEEHHAGQQEGKIAFLLRLHPLPYRLYKTAEQQNRQGRNAPQHKESNHIKGKPV